MVEINHRWLISTGIFSAGKKPNSTILFAPMVIFSTAADDDCLRRMRVCVFMPQAIIAPFLEQRLLRSSLAEITTPWGLNKKGGKRKNE